VEIRDLLLCKRTVSSSFLSQSPPRQVTDVYIVTELMQSDLGRVLDHHNSTLTTEQVRAIMFQFVLGLAHLHENGIIHRDIKPGNLLVDKMWRLKICDLGIARESSRYRADTLLAASPIESRLLYGIARQSSLYRYTYREPTPVHAPQHLRPRHRSREL
jgi:serine/threonine protein kinase